LTCPVFVTTAEFLPQHHRQLEQTRSLIEQADRNGQQRVAEMNRIVENNLLTIIDNLSAPGGCCGSESSYSCRERDNSDAR
jgi:hypothetical protein